MAESLVFLGVVVALNVFAAWFGRDSRDGNDWSNHRPV